MRGAPWLQFRMASSVSRLTVFPWLLCCAAAVPSAFSDDGHMHTLSTYSSSSRRSPHRSRSPGAILCCRAAPYGPGLVQCMQLEGGSLSQRQRVCTSFGGGSVWAPRTTTAAADDGGGGAGNTAEPRECLSVAVAMCVLVCWRGWSAASMPPVAHTWPRHRRWPDCCCVAASNRSKGGCWLSW